MSGQYARDGSGIRGTSTAVPRNLSGPPQEEMIAMQGYLLKRSETLRRWNQRWFSLDPTTARMEYRVQRSDHFARGQMVLDVDSTITLSPINFHGGKEYESCCFYIGTPRKKEYFLAAETPGAAKAWVTTLRATLKVLKAHREAVDSIADGGRAYLRNSGSVAAAAAEASAVARSMMSEVQSANQKAVGHGDPSARKAMQSSGAAEDASMLKASLKAKEEELQALAADLRSRDDTIREMADRLSETAEAAKAAAAAAMQMDKERQQAVQELERVHKEAETKVFAAEARAQAAAEDAHKRVCEAEYRETAALAGREAALSESATLRAEVQRLEEKMRALELALRQADRTAAGPEDMTARQAHGDSESMDDGTSVHETGDVTGNGPEAGSTLRAEKPGSVDLAPGIDSHDSTEMDTFSTPTELMELGSSKDNFLKSDKDTEGDYSEHSQPKQ